MRFRLFGANVEIQMSFWITSLLLGLLVARGEPDVPRGPVVVTWVAVVFVSVLVHELGHALAVKRFGMAPDITLYALGGLTRFQPRPGLSRAQNVVISLAGPFAGFALGGLVLGVLRAFPQVSAHMSPLGALAVRNIRWVNFGWGIINLLPVLPLDGGHVLAHALGPKRAQLTAAISTLVGFLIAAFFIHLKLLVGAVLFGLSAVQSYRRFARGNDAEAVAVEEQPTPPEVVAQLNSAKHALGEDDRERAATVAQRVLEAGAPPRARREALEIIAWTHLLDGRIETAFEVLAEVRRLGVPDAGLEGAVLFGRGDLVQARRVLEAARRSGDSRKQIVGPLVQILIAQGEVGAASDVALSIVDALSEDDARTMAGLASQHSAFASAARLYETIFERLRQPEDAYEAARAEARGGRPERALDMLRSAVAAGFNDRARVLSDAALATLPTLDAVLPAP